MACYRITRTTEAYVDTDLYKFPEEFDEADKIRDLASNVDDNYETDVVWVRIDELPPGWRP